ncbi:hypothetical protein J7L33_01540 [Candidatus Bathyarchaeota archaeon]|nr:hypothetical protein [Candidatus Bathyarchaeota archaeon]
MKTYRKGRIPRFKVKKVEKPPYIIDKSKLHRFHSRNTVFERVMWDPSWKGYNRMYDENVPNMVIDGKPGYSRVDFALAYASWIVHDAFEGGFSWKKIKPYRTPVDTIGIDWTKQNMMLTIHVR